MNRDCELAEVKKVVRRRVEDALRKVATADQLEKIAVILGVKSYAIMTDCNESGTLTGHRKVYPCGCTYNDTVLSDGSLGWGEWTEYCSDHAYDEEGNLKQS